MRETIAESDIFMANLEFPFSDRGTQAADKQFTFRVSPSRVSILQEIGPDIVTVANNHALDYGTDALLDTCDTLDSAGIAHRESNDGLKIDVESSQQSAANLALGSAGYVPDALNLNDYLGNSMSTTATDKERLYNSYLEQYITQTIEAQSAVKSAKVHLSFPKDNGTQGADHCTGTAAGRAHPSAKACF